MKHKFILIFYLLTGLVAEAQVKEPSYSFSVMPTLGNRFISFKSGGSAYVKDSLKKADGWRDALGASLMFGFKSGKTSRIFIGFQFHNFGFTRKKENIRFKDTIHPDIGIMNDLSQTGNNYVDFNYRYMYLAVPFLMSKQISGKNMKSSTLHLLFGGSLAGLVKHDIKAQFHGFSAFGKKEFKLEDKESQPGLLNGNLHIGLRLENPVYGKSTFIFVQPTLYVPILGANYGEQRHHLVALGLEVGLMYKPNKEKLP